MALSPSDVDKTNPAGWPAVALEMFERAITVEYTSLTRAGAPIMMPLTPFLGEDRLTVDVSTGLTYPTKAERARRNPKVSLLFSDPVSSGLPNPPSVLVQGLATVCYRDIQANTDGTAFRSSASRKAASGVARAAHRLASISRARDEPAAPPRCGMGRFQGLPAERAGTRRTTQRRRFPAPPW